MVLEDEDEERGAAQGSSITPHRRRRKKGGWRAVKYILANETFEKLASMSLISNITFYLRIKYNMDGILLVNVVNIWSGSCNFLTLPGALISDAYVGRFWTLLIGSIFSMLGMGTMTVAAGVRKLRPPSCPPEANCIPPTSWQLAILYIGLLLIAIGAGCIRPCNIAFGADQFDSRTEKGRALLARFYNWWYFSFTISLLVALTTVVYIQSNISWTIGFAIPTACFGISSVIFLVGRHTYIYMKPQGSIFVDMVKVIVASYRKRKVKIPVDDLNNDNTNRVVLYDPPRMSYERDSDDEDDDDQLENTNNSNNNGSSSSSIAVSEVNLRLSNRLKWLDKACVISHPNELNQHGIAVNNWRLCSVQQVEQLKSVIGILPIWLAGILCFISMDQQNTFGVLQAIQMNRKLGVTNFVIPPAWIGFAAMAALSLWIITYERVVLPLTKKFKKKDDVRLSVQTRIKIGIIMSSLSMTVGAIVESKRREAAVRNASFVSPLSVAYLVPQFILSGLTEAFGAVTIMEFYTSQMPEYMRSMAGSIFFISLSMASYLAAMSVSIIYRLTKGSDGIAWLGKHDLNKNRLDLFYAILACLGVINYFYFSYFASKFVFVDNKNRVNAEAAATTTLETHTRVE